MSELKPCPFCGSKEVRLVDGDEYSWCMNPTCAIYDYEIRINEWNSRAEFHELATLREQVKVLREALKLSDGMLSDFLRSMPAYTEEGWGYERFDQDGEYCGFERINPDYVIQMFHELAIDVQSNLYAVLEQTKPKDGE